MKKFLLKIAKEIVLLSILGALFVGANLLVWKKEFNGKYPQILEGKKRVIVGHSRIRYAIDDKVLSNTANLSYDGRPHFYSYIILKNIVENNQQIDEYYINFDNRLYEGEEWLGNTSSGNKNFGRYLPLLSLEDCKIISPILPYDKQLQILIKKTVPNFSKEFLENLSSYYYLFSNKKGYYENVLGSHSKLNGNQLSSSNADDNKEKTEQKSAQINEKSLLKLIALLSEKQKRIVLINTPVYEKRDEELERLNAFIHQNNLHHISYLNFQKSHSLADSLYYDKSHLNSKGAAYFSAVLKDSLKGK